MHLQQQYQFEFMFAVFGMQALIMMQVMNIHPQQARKKQLDDGCPPLQVESLACGAHFTIALLQGGAEVHSWGENSYGQLGLGHTNDVPTPQRAASLSGMYARAPPSTTFLKPRTDNEAL